MSTSTTPTCRIDTGSHSVANACRTRVERPVRLPVPVNVAPAQDWSAVPGPVANARRTRLG
jgi:hypothetical protein